MTLFHHFNEHGYTVKELSDHLLAVVAKGEGSRQVMIGPTANLGDGPTKPLAVAIIGVECNEDAEGGVCWVYPDDENVFFPV